MNKSNIEHFALFILSGAAIHFVPWWLFLVGAALAIELDQARTYCIGLRFGGWSIWECIKAWFSKRDTKFDLLADFAAIGLIAVIKYWVVK